MIGIMIMQGRFCVEVVLLKIVCNLITLKEFNEIW